MTGRNFWAGSEIQGGVGNELEIVTYGRSGFRGGVWLGEIKLLLTYGRLNEGFKR